MTPAGQPPSDEQRPDIWQILASLTLARHRAILWLPDDGSWSTTRAYWKVAQSVVWLERHHPELAEAKIVGQNGAANDLRHRLTPLGITLRRYLEAHHHHCANGCEKAVGLANGDEPIVCAKCGAEWVLCTEETCA